LTSARSQRVLVTRAQHQSSELATRLRELGLEPVLLPTIELAPPTSSAALKAALAQLSSLDWLVFTSANAVEAFHRQLAPEAVELLPRVAVIGPATARAVASIGRAPDVVAAVAVAESLADALLPHALRHDGSPARFLLVRAEEARDVLPDALRAAGAEVTIAPAYRTMLASGSIEGVRALFADPEHAPAAITFTSSSSARNLLALCEAAGVKLPEGTLRVSIGQITSETLRVLGYPPHAEAAMASVAALADAVREAIDGAVSS
jgi:uroporphyrinogen-III synthase